MSGLPILVVDDEEEFVSTLVQRLRKRGLSSEGVLTGTAAIAIAIAAGSDFGVVLLDMRLPDMDGAPVLQEIKKYGPTAGWSSSPVTPRPAKERKASETGLLTTRSSPWNLKHCWKNRTQPEITAHRALQLQKEHRTTKGNRGISLFNREGGVQS